MGSFYVNVTLIGTTIEAVRAAAPQPSFLLADGDLVVVFAEADDDGEPKTGRSLSSALGCIAVSAAVHDDDLLLVEVHNRGESTWSGTVPDPLAYFGLDPGDFADLDPSMLDGLDLPAPEGSGGVPEAESLVNAVGRGQVEAVREALEQDFVLATERHQALALALGLSSGAVGWGFRYLSQDAAGYSGPVIEPLP